MEKPRYRTRQIKYNRKRKAISNGVGFWNELMQENGHAVNGTHEDEKTDFVNEMWWEQDGNDSADNDDSDYDPDEENEDSDDSSNDDDNNINEARAMNNDDDVEELLFIEESIYPSGFNFAELLKEILRRENVERNNEEERLHDDVNVSNSTVSEFSVDMKTVFSSYQASEALINDIFFVLHKHLPNINWPAKRSDSGVRNKMNAYINEDNRALVVDICGSGCTAFIGDNYELIRCPVCAKERFYPCHVCAKEISYDNCPHGDRKSQQVFHYR
jgi:hypothetical protein